MEPLELSQLADFFWQRRELVVVDLEARDAGSDHDPLLPRLPHVEPLEIGQQTELGRKRRELVALDLNNAAMVRSRSDRFDNRTLSISTVVMSAISLGSEQSLLKPSKSVFTFFMRNNSHGSSGRPIKTS
jgi:hypothetical protein